jgi:hypothetical protein
MLIDLWISVDYDLGAEAVGNSGPFSSNDKPSQRSLTTQRVLHSDDVEWFANTWYSLDPMSAVIQEIITRTDWQSGNSLSIILKGSGNVYGRKYPACYTVSAPGNAPKLIVNYYIP